jgi:hypothetical protein
MLDTAQRLTYRENARVNRQSPNESAILHYLRSIIFCGAEKFIIRIIEYRCLWRCLQSGVQSEDALDI